LTYAYGFLPLEHWDHGFESRSVHGYMSSYFCVVLSCVGRGHALSRSPVQGVLSNVFNDSFSFSEAISELAEAKGSSLWWPKRCSKTS